ncbi:hypothetical protein IMX17_09095 [Serratia sp. X3]|nr:hypothetical protein [Serratia sp. X3]MBE4973548.1 hypothetical protein [Serratia sp. X3]
MHLIIGVVVFALVMLWLYRNEVFDEGEFFAIMVLAGSALAGYLGTNNY